MGENQYLFKKTTNTSGYKSFLDAWRLGWKEFTTHVLGLGQGYYGLCWHRPEDLESAKYALY